MTVTCHMSVSLDGFVAGPDQTRDTPLGVRGFDLHRWHIDERSDDEVDVRWRDELLSPRGAYVMGRNMFGPVRGEWATDPDWQGWWGDEPPYHAPVFVLTHHEHDPIELTGTTFHFVTDGMASALRQAREAAGDLDVDIAGGASAVRQAFVERAIEVLRLDIAPVWLGRGESLFAGVEGVTLTPVQAEHSPLTTHVRYDVSYA